MYSTGTSEVLVVTPSYAASGSSYAYSYALNNQTANDVIIGFNLSLPGGVPVGEFSSLVIPTGWECIVRTSTNRLSWQYTGDDSLGLQPGGTMTFGFTSAFAPSATQNALVSSQDSFGFSGTTFGPVPEPGSLLALATGMIGLVGLKLRRK